MRKVTKTINNRIITIIGSKKTAKKNLRKSISTVANKYDWTKNITKLVEHSKKDNIIIFPPPIVILKK